MSQLLIIGSKSDNVDIALFCHVAKYIENTRSFERNNK